jgi:hypothetical protein
MLINEVIIVGINETDTTKSNKYLYVENTPPTLTVLNNT